MTDFVQLASIPVSQFRLIPAEVSAEESPMLKSGSILTAAVLGLLLSSSLAESDDRWVVQEKRENIEIYSEFSIDLDGVRGQLDDVQRELRELLGIQTSGHSVQIVMFSGRKRYLEYLAGQIQDARYRKAIFYRNQDVSQIYVYQSPDLMTDVRHEFTHALLHQHLPFVPLWIDEGLAEFMETPQSARSGTLRAKNARWRARLGALPRLTDIEGFPSARELTAEDYRDSWTWVFFLLNESPDSRQTFKSYLDVIASGEAPGQFSQFLKHRDPGAEKRINSYFRKSRD